MFVLLINFVGTLLALTVFRITFIVPNCYNRFRIEPTRRRQKKNFNYTITRLFFLFFSLFIATINIIILKLYLISIYSEVLNFYTVVF